MSASAAFVEHALGLPAADIDADARRAGRTFILDTIGVGVAGAVAPFAREVRRAARLWGAPEHGNAAPALGLDVAFPAASAAFVNGFQIHCQEFDCVHEPAVVHPMATVFAALSAEAFRRRIDGDAFLAAVVVAVDVAAGLGVAATTPLRFFRPATAGVFGATLGLSRLRGFDAGRAGDALGYALAQASGTMQAHVEGKPALPVQIGAAARAAHVACDLAEAGLPGPRAALDGPFGYLPLFESDFDLAPVLAALARVRRITEVSHKPFPTGRAAQGGIEAVRRLRTKGVAADNLRALTLTGPPLIRRLVGRPYQDGMSVNYARLCFAYVGAVALQRGTVGLEDFGAAALADPATARLAQRISVADDASSDPAAFAPQTARAELVDGRVVEVRVDALPGSPAAPLSREAHLAKFLAAMRFGMGEAGEAAAEALIARVDAFETERDVAALLRLATKGTA